MLVEYALTPDIFDSTSYGSSELCNVHLQYLKEVLLEEALVRDLHGGGWSSYIQNWIKGAGDRCPQRAKELLKKLAKQKRLRYAPAVAGTPLTNSKDWCHEAIASHSIYPLNGIIASTAIAEEFQDIELVASIEKLPSATWWRERSGNVRLHKRTEDYLRHLQLVLSHANSIMFVDAYLDPTQPRYREFDQIIKAMKRVDDPPLIEIHRVEYDGSGSSRQDISPTEWEQRFSTLSTILQLTGLTVEVFIWDYFHDRSIITDIVGINLNSGLDLSRLFKEQTTWSRLSRSVRDDIQLEFSPNTGRHKLKHQFRLP